jgi:hypoxanthine phosphoribosyltransferase
MKVLISADQIKQRVQELGRQIDADYQGKDLTIIGVLTGSLIFLADLVREIKVPLRIGLIQASSYRGQTTTAGELKVGPELMPDVRGRDVLLLDDILDTGQTLTKLMQHFNGLGPASLKVGVLVRKIGRQTKPLEPDYCGFPIPDVFVVGYGLDYNDQYRHLPHIAEVPSES